MNVLGIETSCDETAAAVVADGRMILSNIVVSSLKEHSKFGGIIPEIASRRQLEWINPVIEASLREAGLSLDDIDAIAVTHNPGLIGSLLVGLSFARALASALKKPCVEVDHIQAHLYANCLTFEEDKTKKEFPQLPAIGLVVSGGHTSLYRLQHFEKFQLLGQTRDDAAGEAFDKVARLLNLGYPGGPVIDRLAQQVKNSDIQFTCAALPGTLDFSFSGIKTAVLYYQKQHKATPVNRIAYAFQKSVVGILVDKCMEACRRYKIKTLLIGGGVAANSTLRQSLTLAAKENGIDLYFPPLSLCLDNAAMVAGLGYQLSKTSTINHHA
jgi:N6-L-threonylcarbamoyladenine synthase